MEKASDAQRQLHRDLDLLVPGLTGTLGRLDHPSSLAACLAIFQQTKFPEVSQEEVERALKPFYTRTELVDPKAQRIAERLQACRPAGGMVEPLIDEVEFLVREIELFQEQIRQEEGRIAREMETRDSRLLTVPGVGPVVAAVVSSELGDSQRFSRVEEVVAFAGLDSSKKLSGKFEGRLTPISKRGPPAIRESVHNVAMVASRVEPVSKEFFERLRGKGEGVQSGGGGPGPEDTNLVLGGVEGRGGVGRQPCPSTRPASQGSGKVSACVKGHPSVGEKR